MPVEDIEFIEMPRKLLHLWGNRESDEYFFRAFLTDFLSGCGGNEFTVLYAFCTL
jgi:hypothetical protein